VGTKAIRTSPALTVVIPRKDIMSKLENETNNVFRASDSPLTEYEKEQRALHKNLERLRAERLAREAAARSQ